MSQIGSYNTRPFSEGQKFLVLDPATGTTSLVLGSDLVNYIAPSLNYVFGESTRLAAENTDYEIGSLIQTSGATAPGDNFAATYLVVEGGTGDFPMVNGNDLLVIKGDEFLREQLISEDPGQGASLVSMEGGPTVEEAVNQRTIYVGSVAELEGLSLAGGVNVYLTQEGREGEGVVKSGSHTADPQKGKFVDVANGNYWQRSREVPLTPQMFGAGESSNDTAALKAFYEFCIAGDRGYIPSGEYKVNLGELVFDNGHQDTPFPIIDTAGHEAVKFIAAADIDAPFLKFTNGTATTGVGKFWQGGYHGGVSFIRQGGGAANLEQHGIVLRGFFYTKFGYMKAEDIGGSGIHIERALLGGDNPDPYNVAGCEFDGIEANRCGGAAFYNDNFLGLSNCVIKQIRSIENLNGTFFGMGAANVIEALSAGSNRGWAIGDDPSALGGRSVRFKLGLAEIDNPEYGINLTSASLVELGPFRIVHRYNFGINTSLEYWPKVALNIGGTSTVSAISINMVDRIEAGGSKSDLGILADFNSSVSLTDISINRNIQDNAGFGFDKTDYYQNLSSSARVSYRDLNGFAIVASRYDESLLARAPVTYEVPNSGFTTTAVGFDTAITDQGGNFDSLLSAYVVPADGVYNVRANLRLALTDGSRVRMAVMVNGTAANERWGIANGTSAQDYSIEHMQRFSAGDVITISADQNTGAPVALSSSVSPNNNALTVYPVSF